MSSKLFSDMEAPSNNVLYATYVSIASTRGFSPGTTSTQTNSASAMQTQVIIEHDCLVSKRLWCPAVSLHQVHNQVMADPRQRHAYSECWRGCPALIRLA